MQNFLSGNNVTMENSQCTSKEIWTDFLRKEEMSSSNPFNVGIIKYLECKHCSLPEIENVCLHLLPSNQSKIRHGFQFSFAITNIFPCSITTQYSTHSVEVEWGAVKVPSKTNALFLLVNHWVLC
jgi:hypothetical protein